MEGMTVPLRHGALLIELDRAVRAPLATQIYRAVRDAIEAGWLDPGAKRPSWRDMAAQLGVSRGAVRVAYQRLIDEQGPGGRPCWTISHRPGRNR
jgi:DNA-binding transcriptional MocR family regulator